MVEAAVGLVEAMVEVAPEGGARAQRQAIAQRYGEVPPVGSDELDFEDVLAAVPDLQLVGRAVALRNEPVQGVLLIGTDASVRVHGGVGVVADALDEDDAGLLEHRVHASLEQRRAEVRAAGLARAQVQHARPTGRLLADEVEALEEAHGVAQVAELAQLLRGEVDEDDVGAGGEADLRAGLAPIAGQDVGDVRAVRAGVSRVAAGRVVAQRRRGVRLRQGGVDRFPRQQAAQVVGRGRERIAEPPLVPERLQSRGAVRVSEVRVREIETPITDADDDPAAIADLGRQAGPGRHRRTGGLEAHVLVRLLGCAEPGLVRLLERARKRHRLTGLDAQDAGTLARRDDVAAAHAGGHDVSEARYDTGARRWLRPLLQAKDHADFVVRGAGFVQLPEPGVHGFACYPYTGTSGTRAGTILPSGLSSL